MSSVKNIEAQFIEASDDSLEQLRHCYSLLKEILLKDYYDWVQAECPWFTNHGRSHIESVIDTASHMLNSALSHKSSNITIVEAFLLLSGILWHDVAMVSSRAEHASRARDVLSKFKNTFPNVDFPRVINTIVKAHSGKGEKGGLKIPRVEERLSYNNATHLVHPCRLAAILRLADEISENRTRISYHLIDSVPEKNRIFWEYANSISSSYPDIENSRIVIEYSIDKSVVTQRFYCDEFSKRVNKNNDKTITLIEYIVCRLEKVNNERIYCTQHLHPLGAFKEVQAHFSIIDDLEIVSEFDGITFTFRDGGLFKPGEYPNSNVFDLFFEENDCWKPEKLAKKLLS